MATPLTNRSPRTKTTDAAVATSSVGTADGSVPVGEGATSDRRTGWATVVDDSVLRAVIATTPTTPTSVTTAIAMKRGRRRGGVRKSFAIAEGPFSSRR